MARVPFLRPMVCRLWGVVALASLLLTEGTAFQLPQQTACSCRASQHFASLRQDISAAPLSAPTCKQRRKMLRQASAALAFVLSRAPPATASSDATKSEDAAAMPTPYMRAPSPGDKFQFGYSVTPPPAFVAANKPLKTHLDEVNFSPPDARGYTLGITVDPVRIANIRDFGTPEEVAARVVTAEVNRDGVFEVTLAQDPTEDARDGGYDIEYVSDGKRGTKRFLTRIYVKEGFLYVLTFQSKEALFDKIREAEMRECIKSFKPLAI